MIGQPKNKMVAPAVDKGGSDSESDLFPEADGWVPKFTTDGQLRGYYRPADGFKFAKSWIVEQPADPIAEAVSADPQVIAARAALAEADAVFEAAHAAWGAAIATSAERRLKHRRDEKAGLPEGATRVVSTFTDYEIVDAKDAREAAGDELVSCRIALAAVEKAARERYLSTHPD